MKGMNTMAKRKKGMQEVDVTKKERAKELSDDTLEGASGGNETSEYWAKWYAEHPKNDPYDTIFKC